VTAFVRTRRAGPSSMRTVTIRNQIPSGLILVPVGDCAGSMATRVALTAHTPLGSVEPFAHAGEDAKIRSATTSTAAGAAVDPRTRTLIVMSTPSPAGVSQRGGCRPGRAALRGRGAPGTYQAST